LAGRKGNRAYLQRSAPALAHRCALLPLSPSASPVCGQLLHLQLFLCESYIGAA
jgi:hypothetical protein